jgi:hypothetical protein
MKRAVAIVPTDADIAVAKRSAREHDRVTAKIAQARYDRRDDAIVAHLTTGATLAVPRSRITAFRSIDPALLRRVEIEKPGYALWFADADAGIRIDTLLAAALGDLRTIAARALGATSSTTKAAAARQNGAKGGRPRVQRVS